MGMAVSTKRTKTARPAKVISEAFHPGSLLLFFSIQANKLHLLNFLSDIGNPKYVVGKLEVVHCKVLLTSSAIASPHCMGITQLLFKLVCSLEASPKICNIFFVSLRSSPSELMKSATSSA